MNGTIAQSPSARREWPALAVFLLICFGIAGLGGAFTSAGLGPWYDSLRKPEWNPPKWVFGPVWTLLYALMAVAAWHVWRRRESPPAQVGLRLFAVQLVLNLGWTIVFFWFRSPGWAFLEILVLWGAIAATLASFWRVRRTAGLLMVPYLLWVTFAMILNATISSMNP
jgi:tryptophan-rich sensory protein